MWRLVSTKPHTPLPMADTVLPKKRYWIFIRPTVAPKALPISTCAITAVSTDFAPLFFDNRVCMAHINWEWKTKDGLRGSLLPRSLVGR